MVTDRAGEGEDPMRTQSFEAVSGRYCADCMGGYRCTSRACFPVNFPYQHGTEGKAATTVHDNNDDNNGNDKDNGDGPDQSFWSASYRRMDVDEVEGFWVTGCCFPHGFGCDYRRQGTDQDEVTGSGFRCKYCLLPVWEQVQQKRISNTNYFYTPPWRDESHGELPTVRGAVKVYPCSNCMLAQYTCGLRLYPCRWNCTPVALNRAGKVADHDMMPLPRALPADESISGIKQPSMET